MPPIHRTLKNVVKNYSYAEVKVREATSNDPWGPSTSLMAEIAELTYDLAANVEIMVMIWKRINDHGKNWRHVYKSLVLLDYLVRYGQEGIAVQCKENIVAIKTLQDFQHVEDGKDQGQSVREKAKQLAALLSDPEKLKTERSKVSSTRTKFGYLSPDSGGGSAAVDRTYNSSPVLGRERYSPRTASSYAASSGPPSDRPKERVPVPTTNRHETLNTFMQLPRSSPRPSPRSSPRPSPRPTRRATGAEEPQSSTEEDLQLRMALEMSREQHEQDERRRQRGEQIKLQMAIEESKKTAAMRERMYGHTSNGHSTTGSRSLVEPLTNQAPAAAAPVRGGERFDPWGENRALAREPWEISATPDDRRPPAAAVAAAAVGSTTHNNDDVLSELSEVRDQEQQKVKKQNIETWLNNNLKISDGKDNLWSRDDDGSDLSDVDESLAASGAGAGGKKVTPEQFLGPHANLVDLNELVAKPVPASALNPFAMTIGKSSTVNPFTLRAQEEERSRRVPLNQLGSESSFIGTVPAVTPTSWSLPPPPAAVAVVYTAQPTATMVQSSPGFNPFL